MATSLVVRNVDEDLVFALKQMAVAVKQRAKLTRNPEGIPNFV